MINLDRTYIVEREEVVKSPNSIGKRTVFYRELITYNRRRIGLLALNLGNKPDVLSVRVFEVLKETGKEYISRTIIDKRTLSTEGKIVRIPKGRVTLDGQI